MDLKRLKGFLENNDDKIKKNMANLYYKTSHRHQFVTRAFLFMSS